MLIRFLLFFCITQMTMFYSNWAFADADFVKQPDVQLFVKEMVQKYHFNRAELISYLNDVRVRPKVIQSVRYPLEQRPWYSYQSMFVTESRIRDGVNFWNKYQTALKKAEEIYGVPAGIIVATIGVETKYGKNTGDYRVIDALANLAFSDSPRAAFFRSELVEFFLLSREQHKNPLKIMGSYAGAIGQPQFMPSSYRHFAVDFSGNGNIDLSHNEVDVIGSIANYYSKHGWLSNQPVAIPASVKGGKYQLHFSRQRSISKSELLEMGMAPADDYLKGLKYKLLQFEGYYGDEYWLSFHNFDVIKRYNSSDLYAMAVYQLSYYITSMREKLNDD